MNVMPAPLKKKQGLAPKGLGGQLAFSTMLRRATKLGSLSN